MFANVYGIARQPTGIHLKRCRRILYFVGDLCLPFKLSIGDSWTMMKMRLGHIFKGVTVRLLLSAHAALCVWRVVAATGDWRYWGLLLAQLLVLLEAFITLSMKRGTEWKW